MYSLLLLNGGIGDRARAGQPKQLVLINSIPAMVYSLAAADVVEDITQIVVNYPPGWFDDVVRIVAEHGVSTPVTFTEAGATRQESVRAMLAVCENERLLVHESARPLVQPTDFAQLIDDPRQNVSFMSPMAFTVAPVDLLAGRLVGHLDRTTLRGVRFPQKFRRQTLTEAHEWAHRNGLAFTEDATLCAAAGAEVGYIDTLDHNFKLTTKMDLRVANFLLARCVAGDERDGMEPVAVAD